MKKLFTVIAPIILVGVLNYAIAQTSNSSTVKANAINTTGTQETEIGKRKQELQKISQELLDAGITGDKTVFERYLADNYIETNSVGKVRTKAEMLENLQPPVAGYQETAEIEEMQIQEHKNTAIVNFQCKYSLNRNGKRITIQSRYTNIFIKNGEQWTLVTKHHSGIPADKKVAKVSPAIYESYVGRYELTTNHYLILKREGDKLIGQVTGANRKIEFLPENETTFFIQGQRDLVTFVKDDKGQVSHINHRLADGQEVIEKKIK